MSRHARNFSIANACEGKVQYDTWILAEVVVYKIIDRDLTNGHPEKLQGLGTYKCRHCRYWHIGHSSGPVDIRDIKAAHALVSYRRNQ